MGTTVRRAGYGHATTRTLWGLAKSPELGLSKEDLYSIISRETGKEHMRDMTQRELDHVAAVLCSLKDGGRRQKRTDEGGNADTTVQRRKIYKLTGALGWNEDNQRINSFAGHMFGVERLEWLSSAQCGMLIEALKDMVERDYGKGAHADGRSGGRRAAGCEAGGQP